MYRRLLSVASFKEPVRFKINSKLSANESHIIQSPFQKIEIPDISIPDFIFQNCVKFPHKIATECASTGRKYTYEELHIKSINLSSAIRKRLKLTKGDVVAILLPNIPEFGICLLGILKASLAATTLSPLNTSEELQRQILYSNVKAVVTTCALYPLANAIVSSAKVPILTIKTQKTDATPAGAINFQEFVNAAYYWNEDTDIKRDDYALIPYSSGTSGTAKGVVHTHYSVIANLCQVNIPEVKVLETATGSHQDIIPAITPFTHMYSLGILLLNGLMNGARIVTISKFRPEIFIDVLQRYKPTAIYAVPTLISFMTNSNAVKQSDLESVRVIASASAPLSASDEEKFIQKAGKDISVVQGFGTSESGLITANQKNHKPLGSVGVPLPNTEVRVVSVSGDALSSDLKPFQEGELLFKGPQLMKGYYNKPSETESAFTNGWMRSGDLVYYDENNNFYVVDRLKDLIKVKGFQVSPTELEDVIRSYSHVTGATVIGIPHEIYGEVPRAYVTIKSGTKINTEELKQFVSKKVSSYKDIKGGIVVVDSLPKNTVGKFLRRQLKLEYVKSIQSQAP